MQYRDVPPGATFGYNKLAIQALRYWKGKKEATKAVFVKLVELKPPSVSGLGCKCGATAGEVWNTVNMTDPARPFTVHFCYYEEVSV
jgi:hypothetical protein